MLIVFVVAPSMAHPGMNMGSGIGSGFGMGVGGDMDSGMATGKRYRFDQDSVVGWQLMSPEERTAHDRKIRSFMAYGECKAYQEEHNKQMEVRAGEQGVTLPGVPTEPCERMKAKGFFE
jgi:hypothetical protein